jgi:putative ATPase
LELFDTDRPELEEVKPLAERMRPSTIDNFVGQTHLVGKKKPLWIMLEDKNIVSMILWGPPGVGKTTLALIIAKLVEAEFIQLSAVSAGVKDVRDAIQRAERNLKYYRRHTILFIDEIHRFNKGQRHAGSPDNTLTLRGLSRFVRKEQCFIYGY